MASQHIDNATPVPNDFGAAWKRALWVNIIEIALFCTIPIIINPPWGYPTGTQFLDWAYFGLFYQVFERSPGYIGNVFGQEFPAIISIGTTLFFILNLLTYHTIVTKKNQRKISPQGIRRRMRIALYGALLWWVTTAGIQAITGFGFCGTGCSGPVVGTTIDIPVFLVVSIPWALQRSYTQKAIGGLPEKEVPIDEAWAAPVRKAILELGTKYTRLQINEIAEKVNVKSDKQIVVVVEDMIKRGQIVAEYFKSSRSVAFDQQANTQALAKFISELDGQFTAWGKEGKKA